MALAETDSSIISIRGRSGGVYFKKGRDSQHIQAMPRHVNYTHTGAQGEGINMFSAMAGYWMMALLAFFGAVWAAYAVAHIFYKAGKEPKKISGYNWFIYYAMMFPETVRPPFWKPPHRPGDLPDFIITTQGKWTYGHTPPEGPATFPSDYYWHWGTWNGKPCYITDSRQGVIWWDTTRWAVSTSLGYYVLDYTYYSDGVEIMDYYRNPDTGKYCHVYIGKPANP